MPDYASYLTETPQSEKIPGRETEMVRTNTPQIAYAFASAPMQRLERFLILGTENGTYYVGEQELTVDNIKSLLDCLKQDWKQAIDLIVDVSVNNRAAKQSPAIFALALASAPKYNKSDAGRKYALSKINDVCRTGSTMMEFVDNVNKLRGWGPLLRRSVSDWYLDKDTRTLAYQMAKYRTRHGWSHIDVIRMAHTAPENDDQDFLFKYAKRQVTGNKVPAGAEILVGLEKASFAKHEKEIVSLIREYNLTREMIPNTWFDRPSVWEAMLENMPITAMIRNLGKMTEVGLLSPLSNAEHFVANRLADGDRLRRGRVHPWNIAIAKDTYESGGGRLGSLKWEPSRVVSGALASAFELAFDQLDVIDDKRVILAIDTSGSMAYPMQLVTSSLSRRGKSAGMHAAVAAAIWASILLKKYPRLLVLNFSTYARPLPFRTGDTWLEVIRKQIGGGTDYSSPIVYATEEVKATADAIIVMGDMESWYGRLHPSQAMTRYREARDEHPTRLITVNMCSTGTNQVDPKDPLSYTLVGMDGNMPKILDAILT